MTTLPEQDYGAFAARLIAGGVLVDPWFEGQPRFAVQPLVLSSSRWDALRDAAERLASAWNEVGTICRREPEHLDAFFGLTPYQKLMWEASAPRWHGFARADLFETEDGIVACELNCDTPTGQPEAVLLGQAVLADHPGALDPNAGLEAAYAGLLDAITRAALVPDAPRTVGLVYPTELTEDLPLIRLYEQWFSALGFQVRLGSPFNLTQGDGGVPCLFDTPCSVILRHYKTDWWGERQPVWLDEEPFDDDAPLETPLGILLQGELERRSVVVNPFGSVLQQNKKSMAFMWEHLPRFSAGSQETIRRHVPYTVRLEAVHREQLSAERPDWVLKSDYGCEGAEVVIGATCTQEKWDEALELAVPHRWVVQRYFRAREGKGGETINWGVYLVAGQAAGLYCRAQRGATDTYAKSIPCLITSEAS